MGFFHLVTDTTLVVEKMGHKRMRGVQVSVYTQIKLIHACVYRYTTSSVCAKKPLALSSSLVKTGLG